MGSAAILLLAAWMALDASKTQIGSSPAANAADEAGETAEEPKGGAGVSPIELIPRLELRLSFNQVGGGNAFHDTTVELDIQFLDRDRLVSPRWIPCPVE